MRPPTPLPCRPRLAWQWLFWALVAAVSALMLVPRPPPALDAGWDKLNHLIAFAAPTFAGMAARGERAGAWAPALWAKLLAWGAALEVLQGWLPPRSADLQDWLADAAGVALGALAFAFAAWCARRFRPRSV